MASWQAHAVSWLCEWMIKRPLIKSPTLETIRKTLGATQHPTPKGCTLREESLANVRGEWIVADNMQTVGTLLYIHGGAHVACSPRSHRPITSWFAKQGWRVFAPDYRLAPEHRFPAGLEDCVAVYRAIVDSGVAPHNIAVAGDSAGGNLTLALCLKLRDLNLPQPAAIALLSPVTDFTGSGASVVDNSDRCAMFTKDLLPTVVDLYIAKEDVKNPLISPYFADLKGLPPMIFHVGEDEVLRDDSIRVVEHAKQAGIEVQLRTWPVVPHVWQMLHPVMPEARESLTAINAFLRRHQRTG